MKARQQICVCCCLSQYEVPSIILLLPDAQTNQLTRLRDAASARTERKEGRSLFGGPLFEPALEQLIGLITFSVDKFTFSVDKLVITFSVGKLVSTVDPIQIQPARLELSRVCSQSIKTFKSSLDFSGQGMKGMGNIPTATLRKNTGLQQKRQGATPSRHPSDCNSAGHLGTLAQLLRHEKTQAARVPQHI